MSLRETYQSRKNLLAANLTQQGVTASGSEGLTTLINKVLEISPAPPTPVLDHFDVELVDGKKILSYADEQQTPHSQYASLLFTAYDSNDDPIPGLEFDFSVTGESTVSAVCDNNGEYVYTYYSQGIGDVEITASKEVSGSVVSKTYSIRDAIYYNANSITTTTTLTIPNIPTNFKLECDLYRNWNNDQNAIWIEVGSDSNNLILLGQTGSGNTSTNGDMGVFVKINGSYASSDSQGCLVSKVYTPITYTYDNGVQTITDGTNTVSLTNSQITSRNYVRVYCNKGHLKGLTFLPL